MSFKSYSPNVNPDTVNNLISILPITLIAILVIISIVSIATGNILIGLITLTISLVLGIAFLSELLSIIASF